MAVQRLIFFLLSKAFRGPEYSLNPPIPVTSEKIYHCYLKHQE